MLFVHCGVQNIVETLKFMDQMIKWTTYITTQIYHLNVPCYIVCLHYKNKILTSENIANVGKI